MQRSNLERLTDIAIGEAVTSLLGDASRINSTALVATLKRMAALESHPERLAALECALNEVAKEFPRARQTQDMPVMALQSVQAGNKKH